MNCEEIEQLHFLLERNIREVAGIAFFAPDQQVYDRAKEILAENPGHITVLKMTEGGEDAVIEARKAVSDGINIIIARGRQASLIRQYTNISVVDITLTAQEIGLLILEMKEKIGKAYPRIGLVGNSQMFCDTTHLGQLFDADVRKYPLDEGFNFQQMVEFAIEEQVDGIISGANVLDYVKDRGIVTGYFNSTGESVRNSINQAEALYRVSEVERNNYVHFTSILESAINGLIQVNKKGEITVINHAMELMLRKSVTDVMGKKVTSILEGLDNNAVKRVLNSPKESYATFVKIGNENMVVLMIPVVIAEEVDGAIISCNKVNRSSGYNETKQMQDQYLRGYVARTTFEDIEALTKGMPETIEMAKCYALSTSPILLKGESGDEREELAQAIHNHSMRKSGPYISVNIAGLSDEAQIDLLFGKRFLNPDSKDRTQGALMAATNGTLVIHALDKMGVRTQFFLNNIIQNNTLIYNDLERIQDANTRIIGACTKNLYPLVEKTLFRDDLYYIFHSLTLVIPPLRDRKADMERLIDIYIPKYIEKYSKFHVFTAGAKRVMLQYSWAGNRVQLERFCERLILTAGKRTITDNYVTLLLEQLYGHNESKDKDETKQEDPTYEDSYEKLIRNTLRKYNGNKGLTAKALHISTTTLWRKMKKYNID